MILLFIVQLGYYLFSAGNIFATGPATLFLAYVFYFVLGMYARSHYSTIKNGVTVVQKHPYGVCACLLVATVFGTGYTYIRYFSRDLLPQVISLVTWIELIITPFYYIVIFTVGVFTALKISEISSGATAKLLHVIGRYSMGIFLIHAFILYALESVLFIKTRI